MPLAKYFRRGKDRGKPSPFNESWKKALPKSKHKSFQHIKGITKSGNTYREGLFDCKLASREGSEYFATFNKPPLVGAIKTCTVIVDTIIDPNTKIFTELQQQYLKTFDQQILQRLNQIKLAKPRYITKDMRLRVTELEAENGKWLAAMVEA